MKIVITDTGSLLGPYEEVQVGEDRLTVDGGAQIPFNVIGEYHIVESDLPRYTDLSNYIWNGTEIIEKTQPSVDEPLV